MIAVPREGKENREGRSNGEEKIVAKDAKGLLKNEVDRLLLTAVIAASLFLAIFDISTGVGSEPDEYDDVTDAKVLCNIVTAGLSAVALPSSGTVTSFDPQITRSIGNSFGQLLTNKAVLTAFALGGDRGGSG